MLLTLEQRVARSSRASARRQTKKEVVPKHAQVQQKLESAPCYDLALLKPVHVAAGPPPPMSEAERTLLHQELGCLRREQATTQRAIDHLLNKLGQL